MKLFGKPAVDQGWNRFRETLVTHQRNSSQFTAVSFPLRVGEHQKLHDGLVGFWRQPLIKQDAPTLSPTIYLPQTPDDVRTSSIKHPEIVLHGGNDVPHLQMSLESAPEILTMLVDPQTTVHITSGILPVKTMQISPDLYLPALQNLEMLFFSGPFITKQHGVELPLPTEPGYRWSFLTKENGVWHDSQDISPVEQNATFSQPHIIREGWLKLTKDGENP